MEGDENLPHDELNLIEEGGRYGWPYCCDDGEPAPEYPKLDYARFRVPLVLLPAHAAPLGMTYYFDTLLPREYRGMLIVGYHGYRATGHRVVAFETDAQGKPTGRSKELVSGWEAADERAMGVPTDVKVGTDGAIYVTEDRNGTVLRIAPLR